MQPLRLNFKPSYRLTCMLVCMGLMMATILIAMPIIWHIKLAVLLLIIASVIFAVVKYALLILPASIVAIDVTSQNKIYITRRNGQDDHEFAICGDSVVTPYLTVINLQQKNAPLLRRVFKISIVVLPDTTDAASFRKLRTWLRWGIKPV